MKKVYALMFSLNEGFAFIFWDLCNKLFFFGLSYPIKTGCSKYSVFHWLRRPLKFHKDFWVQALPVVWHIFPSAGTWNICVYIYNGCADNHNYFFNHTTVHINVFEQILMQTHAHGMCTRTFLIEP